MWLIEISLASDLKVVVGKLTVGGFVFCSTVTVPNAPKKSHTLWSLESPCNTSKPCRNNGRLLAVLRAWKLYPCSFCFRKWKGYA